MPGQCQPGGEEGLPPHQPLPAHSPAAGRCCAPGLGLQQLPAPPIRVLGRYGGNAQRSRGPGAAPKPQTRPGQEGEGGKPWLRGENGALETLGFGGVSMKSSGLLSPARVPQAVSQQSSARCLAGGSAAARSAVPGKGCLPGRGHCPATGQSRSRGEKPRRFTADGKGGEQPRHGAPLCSLAFSAFQWATTLNPWARRRGTHRGDAAGAPLRSPGGCFGGILLCLA